MKTKEEIRKEIEQHYISHEAIAKWAYAIWEQEGKPDGEKVNRYGVKIKNRHWLQATMFAETVLEVDVDFFYWVGLWDEIKST